MEEWVQSLEFDYFGFKDMGEYFVCLESFLIILILYFPHLLFHKNLLKYCSMLNICMNQICKYLIIILNIN